MAFEFAIYIFDVIWMYKVIHWKKRRMLFTSYTFFLLSMPIDFFISFLLSLSLPLYLYLLSWFAFSFGICTRPWKEKHKLFHYIFLPARFGILTKKWVKQADHETIIASTRTAGAAAGNNSVWDAVWSYRSRYVDIPMYMCSSVFAHQIHGAAALTDECLRIYFSLANMIWQCGLHGLMCTECYVLNEFWYVCWELCSFVCWFLVLALLFLFSAVFLPCYSFVVAFL